MEPSRARLTASAMILALAAPAAPADMDAGREAVARRDYDTAFREFLAEAEAGDPRAQAIVANMYRRGWGTSRSMPEALAWYRRAAEGGDALAQYNLAVAYRDGAGVEPDQVLATRWFERAARQGRREAQRNLGIRYAKGQGTAPDPVRAYAWLSRAVAGGDIEALRRRRRLEASMSEEQIREARKLAARMP